MKNDYGMIEPDSWGSYLSIPELQQAIRLQPGTSVNTTLMPNDWIPAPDTTIWRFMDFPKFMSLINDGTLFFTRVDRLEDEFEGTWSDATKRLIEGAGARTIKDEGWRIVLTDEETGQRLRLNLPLQPVGREAQQLLKVLPVKDTDNLKYRRINDHCILLYDNNTGQRFWIQRRTIYQLGDINAALKAAKVAMYNARHSSRFTLINCWHVNAHESDAMWSRYSDRKASIAIKTDVESLVQSFVGRYPNALGYIQYVDFDTDVMPAAYMDLPHWFKRIQFNADQELRVVMDETVYSHVTETTRTPDYSRDICEVGMPYRVDPSVLIREVVVAPSSDAWVVGLIRSILAKYGIEGSVVASSLGK